MAVEVAMKSPTRQRKPAPMANERQSSARLQVSAGHLNNFISFGRPPGARRKRRKKRFLRHITQLLSKKEQRGRSKRMRWKNENLLPPIVTRDVVEPSSIIRNVQ